MSDPKDKLIQLLRTQKTVVEAQREASRRIEEERSRQAALDEAERVRLAQNKS
jgi:hypothetical protein